MKRIKTGAAVAAILALALTACGSDGDGGGERNTQDELSASGAYNQQARENVKDGGTFTRAIGEINEQLNANHADNSADTTELSRMYNAQLQLLSAEGEVSFNPDYLTDVQSEVVDGNRVVTYTINDEASFNDGTPIDWTAFEARWKVANGENEEYAVVSTDGYSQITSVEQGETTKQAVVTYDGPWVWWRSQFPTVIHPESAKDPETFNTAYTQDAHDEWGAGPFHVKELEPGGNLAVFERNPKWWGEPAKLDEFIFRAFESTAAINAFRNGEIDAVEAATQESMSQVEDMDGIDIRRASDIGTGFLHINAASAKLGDPDVRKAVALGLDRDILQQVRYVGMGWDPEPPGMMSLYSFQDGYRDTLGELGAGTADAAEAKRLLDEAGWTVGDGGIREKDGQRLELLYPVIGDLSTTENVAKAAKEMMKQIGVDLKLDPRSSEEFTDTYTKKDYDLFQLNWGTGDPDENFFYFCYLYCSDAGYTDQATIDEFAPRTKEIGQMADRDEAIAAFLELEKEILQTWQVFPLGNGPKIWVVKDGLANFGSDLFAFGPLEDIGWQK